jgi:hypothetical protein
VRGIEDDTGLHRILSYSCCGGWRVLLLSATEIVVVMWYFMSSPPFELQLQLQPATQSLMEPHSNGCDAACADSHQAA